MQQKAPLGRDFLMGVAVRRLLRAHQGNRGVEHPVAKAPLIVPPAALRA
jgi:hypothetical protein